MQTFTKAERLEYLDQWLSEIQEEWDDEFDCYPTNKHGLLEVLIRDLRDVLNDGLL